MMAGISGTTFGVAEPITRGDFLASLIQWRKADAQADKNFADVKEDAPYAAEIAIAKELGIALGMGCNRFMPDKAITRQDMMVLVDRAFAQAGIPMTVDASVTLEAFADAAQVADYAKTAWPRRLCLAWLPMRMENSIRIGTTTRAEAAVLLYGITQNNA